MKLPVVANRSVLVTGCSSGIGRATARWLKNRGWRVLAGARRARDLSDLAAEGFDALELDVADPGSVAAGAARALELTGGRLGALVNNAGYGQPGALEDISREALRRQFDINVIGLQDLTNRVLPAMIAAGSGRIVHVSSVLGRSVMPMLGAYCATKHAVDALATALRVELRGTGVGVIVIEPGPIATDFRKNALQVGQATLPANSRFNLLDLQNRSDGSGLFVGTPESVARKIAAALEARRPARRYKVTFPAHATPFFWNLLPESLVERALAAFLPPLARR